MQITKLICPESKYAIKCPDKTKKTGITVHNTYNDASAMSEASYMIGRPEKVSFHASIDDYRVVECLPFDRSCYAAGDGRVGYGNKSTINIEICYSKSGGTKFINAEKLAAEYIAKLCKNYGWTTKNIGTHQMRSGKYCPHRTLDMGWNRFLKMVENNMKTTTKKSKFKEYKVKITARVLNVRKDAGTKYKIVTSVKKDDVYTIVDEKAVSGTKWGKLKSGKGWISLAYTKKI